MSRLTVGLRPRHPPPRRVPLGSDAWALLVEVALAGVALPPPFRLKDGPALDATQHAATVAALRDAGLLRGDGADLLADLDPSLRESLQMHARPQVVVDSSVGLGDAQRATRIAITGQLASAIARSQRPVDDDRLELGPIELSAMLLDDVASEVVRGFGDLDDQPDREPLQLDAAVSLAAVHALAGKRADLACAVLDRATVPAPLAELAAGLEAVARVDVGDRSGARVLIALRLDDGWWTAGLSGEDVVLRPVGEGELVTEIASALTSALRLPVEPAAADAGAAT